MAALGKMLIVLGVFLIIGGMVLLFFPKIPFLGKLPGDISFKKENFEIYIPLGTSILLSIVVSGIVWLIHFLGKK